MYFGGNEDKKLSAGGFSGKTQAILREAKRKQAAPLPESEEYLDGEDKSPLKIFVEGPKTQETWVTRSKLEDPMVEQELVNAHAPSSNPLPDWIAEKSNGLDFRDHSAVFTALRRHQDSITKDMVMRESGRETVRKQLLAMEFVPWRREQMEKVFDAQRTVAHTQIKKIISTFEVSVNEYRGQYAKETAAAQRIDKIMSTKKAYAEASKHEP